MPDPAAPTAAAATLPLRLLRAVAAISAGGSAAAAAQALHLSTSALTRAIQQAEQQLGLLLFERGTRGMSSTPAGEALAARACRALAELDAAQAAAASVDPAARQGTLRRSAADSGLQALVAVAGWRSESAAARALGLSQPALHQAVRKVEHAVRAQLFERSRHGSHLTSAGEQVLRHVKLALAEVRIGHEEIDRFRGLSSARVAIGALPMASDVLVPQALSRLLRQRPGTVATVADGTYEALLHQLRHGDLDLVVGPLRGAAAPADVVEQPLFEDHLVPVVRRGHPLLAQGPGGRLEPLLSWPWIGPLPGTPAHAAFLRTFAMARRRPPRVELHANAPAVLRALLLAGDHVALLSPLQIRADVAAGLLAVVPLTLRGTGRSIGLTLRRDGMPSSAAAALDLALREVAREVTGAPARRTRRHGP